MAVEWASARISDVTEVTDYVANGSFESLRENVTYRSEPDFAVLVRLVDQNAGWVGPFVYVDKASYDFLRKSALDAGDVIIANVGANAGTVFRAPNLGTRMTLGPNAVLCRPKDEEVLRRDFLYYYLISESGQQSLQSILSGSAQPKFNKTDFRAISIPIPPLGHQHAISHILGTLDDKIGLNRRMNETLEAMARTLFKSWFVDFDPVRAKAEGRDPGLPQSLAALFPARLVESELGEIPEGWKVRSLDEIARFLNGLALQNFPPVDGRSLPVIKIAQLRAGNTNDSDLASADLEADYVVQDGDILFSWSGSLECVLWAGGPGALNQHLFKVTSDEYPRWLCYLGVHQHLADFRQIAAGKATTMGHIQRHHLSEAKLPVPSPALVQVLDPVVGPFVESTWRRAVQSRTLAALRDTMLPKLLSGELRLKDAERLVEVAT
jgi:type I restriction enzyme S subunit